MLISIETHITCDFPGGGGGEGVRTSVSAHVEEEKNKLTVTQLQENIYSKATNSLFISEMIAKLERTLSTALLNNDQIQNPTKHRER